MGKGKVLHLWNYGLAKNSKILPQDEVAVISHSNNIHLPVHVSILWHCLQSMQSMNQF